MLIPLGTDRPNERKAVVTHFLIALNLGVFVAVAILGRTQPDLAKQTVQWGAVWRLDFHLWQPITSAFFHAGFMHIFGNMIFLLVFGPPVEDRFGRIGFTIFYLAGGAASGLAHIALENAPAIGASGAVAAVSGAFLVLFPRTRIKCLVIFLVIGIFMIPSWWLIGLYIILDLFTHFITPDNGIANIAHLGGYAFGTAIALFLLITHILPREPYDLFSILKHRQRRRAFAAAGKQHETAAARVRTDHPAAPPADPAAERLAEKVATARAHIGRLISDGETDQAADEYLAMLQKFADAQAAPAAPAKPATGAKAPRKPKSASGKKAAEKPPLKPSRLSTPPLTLHRDAQYQIANTLYQRGDRVQAAEAFSRLLDTYPADPERHIITILIARTRAHDQHDPVGAIQLLEDLAQRAHDNETQELIESELESVRALATPDTENNT